MAGKSYHDIVDVNARSSHKKGPKKLDHIRVHKGENGGHMVEHHFEQAGPQYHEPEQHIFGKSEGAKLMSHIREHMGVVGDEDKDEEKGESAAGAAY